MNTNMPSCRFWLLHPLLWFAILPATTSATSGGELNRDTSVEINGTVFGAQADERGPIGGGAGYHDAVTSGDHEANDLESLQRALANAKPGQTVFIPGDAEIDFTALIYIEDLVLEVPEGVTLASDRGHRESPGGLLTSDALKTPKMLRVGPGVRITGLRLRGPNTKRYLDHHRRAFKTKDGKAMGGGRKYYYKLPTSNGIVARESGLRVDNCEISGFSHAGVDLRGGDDHHIHHNYIHHCQYQGLGYGICHNTASSLIECNLFDWNRHSIAGTGRPGCSYTARNNVELGESLSHCFDMHGGRDRGDGTNIAGTTIEITHNTFRAKKLPIKIRGVPEESCTVTGNWFLNHPGPRRAVSAEERTTISGNAYGSNPPTTEGEGDSPSKLPAQG